MLEQLKRHYKEAIVINQHPNTPDDYEWFYTKEGEQIGILKSELTEKEKQLLSIFLTPLTFQKRPLTKEEQAWHRFFVQGDDSELHLLANHTPYYRFIQFQTKQTIVDRDHFREAVEGLFQESVLLIWEQDHRGIIIEKKRDETEQLLPFTDMIDALSSDFYMTLHIFIGQTHPYDASLSERFRTEKYYFELANTYIRTKTVYTVSDILPLALICDHPKQQMIRHSLSFLTKVDDDLLETVKVFLECDLNVSLAAKKLYMHRNSLQYRIEKFIEKTGIDIRHFKGAAAMYLAILLNEYTKH
ncbi:PucR family transcriptional regulator [Anoxybacillus sp. J5B_2022]|uniref:PucR family transcriptional regulator n=1 Tax=Anoxybacillus sp. J5B_2022 TaxID=3003246 RepID=UPI0022867868|nr:helix-turn-helix domain-containing protein [Anoxybacillus sp. J5B_2022]MCZ0754961.1 helix-turn-helix domain-containing protein [Anoxybacillus sp. J5B_2022]